MQENIARIEKIESLYNKHNELLQKVTLLLEEYNDSYQDYLKIMEYYNSQAFYDDVTLMENNQLPESLRCGVLTEDTLYDLFTDKQSLLKLLLEVALKMTNE